MRLKLGRPDLRRYDDRFDLPPAEDGTLSVTFLGVATLLVDDGESALMTDGFFSRPGLLAAGLARVAPDQERIDGCLARARVRSLECVMPVHTHFDHAMDSAAVAARTGATLVGGTSAAQIARGGGLTDDRIVVAESGKPMAWGAYDITMTESHHCPPDRYPGKITEPLVPPVRVSAYRCGEAWSIVLRHRPSGKSALVMGSAGYVEGSLAGQQCDIAYLGVGQLGIQSDDYIETYWRETVRTVGARRVVLIHWDDFFRSLDQPLRALPYAGDDLDNSLRVLDRLANEDGVSIHLPSVWARENPWA
jgi:L-ascorbate metabolism protein UlaG (beta-lactamase superfamily)